MPGANRERTGRKSRVREEEISTARAISTAFASPSSTMPRCWACRCGGGAVNREGPFTSLFARPRARQRSAMTLSGAGFSRLRNRRCNLPISQRGPSMGPSLACAGGDRQCWSHPDYLHKRASLSRVVPISFTGRAERSRKKCRGTDLQKLYRSVGPEDAGFFGERWQPRSTDVARRPCDGLKIKLSCCCFSPLPWLSAGFYSRFMAPFSGQSSLPSFLRRLIGRW